MGKTLLRETQPTILGQVFRRINYRLARLQIFSVEAKLRKDLVELISYEPLKLTLPLEIFISTKRMGRGVPYAPFTIYINDREILRDKTDREGRYTYEIVITDYGTYVIDVYLHEKRLGGAYGSDTVTVSLEAIEIVPAEDIYVTTNAPGENFDGGGLGMGYWGD